MSKLWLRCALAWCLALTAGAAGAIDGMVTVLTGGTSSVYYQLGLELAKEIARTMPDIKTSVQATKGAAENLNLLQGQRGDIGFTLGDALSAAWKGSADAGFKAPLKKLRAIATLYPNYIQIVARADSGVRSLADLKGKRISVGVARSGIELDARAIFAAAGIAYKDFAKVEYLPFGESIELLKDRKIDVTLQSAGLGVLPLRDLASSQDIVVVPIPPDIVARTGDPAYVAAVIPARTYRGQAADIPTAAVQNYLVTHDGVSDDTVYGVTRALWSGLDRLAAAHPAAKAIELKRTLEGLPVPLHPGAQRYYQEIGLLK